MKITLRTLTIADHTIKLNKVDTIVGKAFELEVFINGTKKSQLVSKDVKQLNRNFSSKSREIDRFYRNSTF